MRMESPLNQRLRRSPPDVVYTPIDVTSVHTLNCCTRRRRLPKRVQARDAKSYLVDGAWKLIEVRPSVELACGTATTQAASGRPSSWSWATGTTPTGTGTATAPRPRSRSSRCSPGRSSWRWNGQAEGTGPQAPARSHVPVRVGADCGAGKRGRAGRRGALDRKTRG